MVSILWSVVYWRWHPAFLQSISSALAIIVLLSIPIEILLECEIGMFVGAERFRTRAAVAVAAQAAGLAGFAVLLLFGRTPENAMWGSLLGALAGVGIAAVILKDSFRGIWKIGAARENLLPTLSYGMRGQFGKVASFFNYRLDVFVINYFLNPAQVGLYALGVVISEALWQIPSAASVALFPRTARTVDQGASEFTCLIMRQILVIACAGAIAIAIGSWLFLPLIFGERFRPSIAVVWLLLPGTVALSLGRVGVSDLAGRGKSGYSSVFSITALVVTVALDLILIPRLGIQGAALASSAAYFTNTILIITALKYELKVTWRSLLVPTYAELASYQHAWARFRDGARGTMAIPNGQPE
jgi:O-antigen/teichoic acid export membrane protein